jgi:antitoxin PrlF
MSTFPRASKSSTSKTLTVRVTEKGQVTIPKELRDAFGIGAGTHVEFVEHDGAIVVRKISGAPGRGRRIAERLRGRSDVGLTTDEIMALTRGTEA